ncbi:AAA family ATPase [Candidatus Poribacteria bacterium]|nr:AAA family ATPase [Candidatus Poribacteria bacterium]
MTRHFIPKFIGRFLERRLIEGALNETLLGHGQFLLIQGLAGAGKSRLLGLAVDLAQACGFSIVLGMADEGESKTPYGLFLDAFRRLRRRLPAEAHLTWFPPAAQWTKLVTFQSTADLNPQQLFNEIFDIFHNSTKPILLALEDLHWADVASLDILYWLVRDLGGERLCILATCRTEGRMGVPQQAERIHRLMRQPASFEIPLVGLSLSEVREFVQSIMPNSSQPGGFVHRLYQRTEGNPLFLEEVLRRIPSEETQPDVPLPSSFREALLSRLPVLSSGDLRLLKLASVVGAQFDVPILAYLGRQSEEDVIECLSRLSALHLIRETSDREGFRFWHALTRDALYGQLLTPDRRALHRRVAQYLLHQKMAQQENYEGTIGYHLESAKEHPEAVHHYIIAAEHAASLGAFAEAFAYGERALSLISPSASNRANLTFQVSKYARLAGQIQEALVHCEAAEALYRELGKPLEYASVLLHRGDLCWLEGDGNRAMESFQDVLALREAEEVPRDAPVWAWGLARMSQRHYLDSRWTSVIPWAQQGIEMARRLSMPEVESHCLINMGVAYAMQGQQERGVAFLHNARNIALEANSPEEASRSYVAEIDVWSNEGHYHQARNVAIEGADYVRQAGAPVILYPELVVCCVEFQWLTGQWSEALDALPKLERLVHEQPSALVRSHFLVLLGRIATAQGRFEAAERTLTEAVELAEGFRESQWFLPPQIVRSCLALAQQKPQQALEHASETFRKFPQPENVLFAELGVVGLQAACRLNLSADSETVTQLCRHVHQVPNSDCLVARFYRQMAEGLRSILANDFNKAVQALNPALSLTQEMHTPEQEANVRQWLATALGQRGTDADRREAASQRNQALAILRQIPGHVTSASQVGPMSTLSNREREVALLVAEGLTNSQIADRLFIAERTVAVHVSRILKKLGLDSRTQLTALIR